MKIEIEISNLPPAVTIGELGYGTFFFKDDNLCLRLYGGYVVLKPKKDKRLSTSTIVASNPDNFPDRDVIVDPIYTGSITFKIDQ